VAEQVGMTVSGAWSRYRRARPPEPPRLGRWQQVLADALAWKAAEDAAYEAERDARFAVQDAAVLRAEVLAAAREAKRRGIDESE
jgi:hypothetical protein